MRIFGSFNILIPKIEYMQKWPVIACDQFTSQPEYWNALRKIIGYDPSTLHCIMPEAELRTATDEQYQKIRDSMNRYLEDEIFNIYPDSFVYVERTLLDGTVRQGVVGVIDLEEYDYRPHAASSIRATEKTVVERIPPRMKVRKGAMLDLSHVLLLCDDERKEIIEPLRNAEGNIIYEIDLLQNGGHIKGKLISGEEAGKLRKRLDEYCARKANDLNGMLFLVGDGNHSLATAKACYEELKRTSNNTEAIERARYAVVELENIHDDAQRFEPIHRIVYDVDYESVLDFLLKSCGGDDGYPVEWIAGDKAGVIILDKAKGILPIGILQQALDDYLQKHDGAIDYIHGEETVKKLAKGEKRIGFILPSVSKDDFFRGIAEDGVLPRKTFSMGEAQEKRYYLETRRL